MNCRDEGELLARCRRGESGAWDELFDRYYAAAARFIFQLSADISLEDVEEISQETFLAVIKNLASFQGQSQFQTWLFRIAANKARDYWERQRAVKRGSGQVVLSLDEQEEDGAPLIAPASSNPGPDEVLVNAEKAAMIAAALRQLGLPCQEIIELRYFGDMEYEEIGRSLELNVKTVSSRLSRCLDRLEAIVEPMLKGGSVKPSPSNPYAV
jgi:RNA polymerase sigma-70 factor (ECF subfamily)